MVDKLDEFKYKIFFKRIHYKNPLKESIKSILKRYFLKESIKRIY